MIEQIADQAQVSWFVVMIAVDWIGQSTAILLFYVFIAVICVNLWMSKWFRCLIIKTTTIVERFRGEAIGVRTSGVFDSNTQLQLKRFVWRQRNVFSEAFDVLQEKNTMPVDITDRLGDNQRLLVRSKSQQAIFEN